MRRRGLARAAERRIVDRAEGAQPEVLDSASATGTRRYGVRRRAVHGRSRRYAADAAVAKLAEATLTS